MGDEAEYTEADGATAVIDVEQVDAPQVDEAPAPAAKAEADDAGSDDALLRDPKALLGSYKELQGKSKSDAESRKELEQYKAAVDILKADPKFVEWYSKTYDGRQESPAPKVDLADDDLVSVKDMRVMVQQMLQEGLQSERGFIEDMRRKEADRQRDELLAEAPDAKDYTTPMQVLQAQNPNLSLKQLYILASHGAKQDQAAKKTVTRQQKASKFDRAVGVTDAPKGEDKSLDEILGDIWERDHKS